MKLHSPVELNFKQMTVQLTLVGGTKVIFQDESLPNVEISEIQCDDVLAEDPICGAFLILYQVLPQVQNQLDTLQELFSTPTSLPLVGQVDHAIPLVPDAKIVNQRPYRLPCSL